MTEGTECSRATFEHEALQLTSLNKLIEWLGGDFSFQAREKIYQQAQADGLATFAETFVVQKPNTGISLNKLPEPYTGNTSQNQILLFFIRSRLVLEGYTWDPEINYLKKSKNPPREEESCGPTNLLEDDILAQTGLTLDQITAGNRIRVLRAFKTFLENHPHADIPIETVQAVMGNRNENMITIDDGPNEHTLEILDILDRAGVCAVFYLIGENIKKYPNEVKAIVERGHIVGYHTMEHKKNPYQEVQIDEDFSAFQKTLDDALKTHYPLVFLRVPYGTDESYEAYKALKHSETGALRSTTYLPQADGTPRGFNWDIQDNFLRDKDWKINDADGKSTYYLDRYQHHTQQVFLLHQESDDVMALRTMLSTPVSNP